jgi:hypothetical protein
MVRACSLCSLLGVLAVSTAGCGTIASSSPLYAAASPEDAAPTGLREATPSERAAIDAGVKEEWQFENGAESWSPEDQRRAPSLQRRHYRFRVVAVRVSRAHPGWAVAAVEVRDSHEHRVNADDEIFVLRRWQLHPLRWGGDGYTGFALNCVAPAAEVVRELLCPNPWSQLGFSAGAPPPIRLSASVAILARRWHGVALPGIVCGATQPIRLHWEYLASLKVWDGRASVHSTRWPWWPSVEVAASGPYFGGDLEGNGTPDAYFGVSCTNGGGTANGQLAFSAVIFSTRRSKPTEREHPARLIAVITTQQPFEPLVHTALISHVDLLPGRAVLHEAWYGPEDPACCSSGRATTTWTYAHGTLVSPQTVVSVFPGSWASQADKP